MKTAELRQMSVDELKAEHLSLLREQFNMRMQKGGGELTRTHAVKNTRKNIARVLTILTEKQEDTNE